MITTGRPPDDRRILRIGMTDEGRRIYEQAAPAMDTRPDLILSALLPDEQAVIFQIIDKLHAAASVRDFSQSEL